MLDDDARLPAESDHNPPAIPAGYTKPEFDCRRATLGAVCRAVVGFRTAADFRTLSEVDRDEMADDGAACGQALRTSATTSSWIHGEASILK